MELSELVRFIASYIRPGAIPDSPDQNGLYPLHIAAINDRHDILEMILNAENDGVKCDIDATSGEGDREPEMGENIERDLSTY